MAHRNKVDELNPDSFYSFKLKITSQIKLTITAKKRAILIISINMTFIVLLFAPLLNS